MIASRIPEGVRLAMRPRPSGSGVVRWTLPEGILFHEDLGDSKSAGGAQGRWRESESCFDFVTIAVFS